MLLLCIFNAKEEAHILLRWPSITTKADGVFCNTQYMDS